MGFHIGVDLLLEVDAYLAVGSDYYVGANSSPCRNVTVRIPDCVISGIVNHQIVSEPERGIGQAA